MQRWLLYWLFAALIARNWIKNRVNGTQEDVAIVIDALSGTGK